MLKAFLQIISDLLALEFLLFSLKRTVSSQTKRLAQCFPKASAIEVGLLASRTVQQSYQAGCDDSSGLEAPDGGGGASRGNCGAQGYHELVRLGLCRQE